MPVPFLSQLSGHSRTSRSNKQLYCVLWFVAGAMNAGGFPAVRRYTADVTGIVSTMADQIALGNAALTLSRISALTSFLAGAANSAVLINWAATQKIACKYAAPLMAEAILLLCFGLMGVFYARPSDLFVPLAVAPLSYVMGLQNAIIIKVSRAEIGTIHVTGLVTDIGIELGKLTYWNDPKRRPDEPEVHVDWARLHLLFTLLCLFFLGGLAGALAFSRYGYIAALLLAALLVMISAVPVADDLSPHPDAGGFRARCQVQSRSDARGRSVIRESSTRSARSSGLSALVTLLCRDHPAHPPGMSCRALGIV